MPVGVLELHLHIPGCASLKEKRRRLKPLLARLRREFNVSAAEVDHLDVWQDAAVLCAWVSNDHAHLQRSLQSIVGWVEKYWPDMNVVEVQIEII
ncbi:MAG: DUF503 domain-containing protein [Anaerolineae bacterium]|nr:DUF503 domain-containing protein [Anaerolineae bacterium]